MFAVAFYIVSVLRARGWLPSGVPRLSLLTSSVEDHEYQVFLRKQILSTQAPFFSM